ncbi:hypothetical protein BaRGS_00011217 [Batillaria attramentaria]|uniref:Methionine synthase reductase n=1 Tax=Batillaria attramentaria TaxID=370345 RepID=A0ABD0LEV9_9CAEN
MPGCSGNRYLLLYGSQTGQAKAIAEEICERSSQHGLFADLHCLSMTDKKFSLEKEKCVVLVTSTTGDGEPPETALKFVRRIKKKTLPDDYLAHMNYTILGLGDTNYTNFCNNAKVVDRRLHELGGQRFYPSGFADEAVGLEVVVDPWIDGLFPALQKFLGADPSISPKSDTVPAPTSDTNSCASPDSGVSESASTNGSADVSSEKEVSKTASGSGSQATVRLTGKGSSNSIEPRTAENLMNGFSSADKTETELNDAVNRNSADTNRQSGGGEDKMDGKPSLYLNGDVNKSMSENKTGRGFASSSDGVLRNAAVSVDSSEPCLRVSLPPLSEGGLTLPVVTPAYLAISYLSPDKDLGAKLASLPWQNNCKLPSAASDIAVAKIVSAQRLTTKDASKKTLLLRLNIEKCGMNYRPGDSISVICTNHEDEVNQLIARLGLELQADLPIQISIMPDTKKKRAAVPPHFPEEIFSLRHILKTCVDIREPPKKALLRVLVDFTSDAHEKRRLQELCSKEGAGDYTAFVRGENVSLLDVLCTFPTCHPPVERILEHLSRLQPRPYSACSCLEFNPGHVDIAFNVVDIPQSSSRVLPRRGLCTGWLDDVTQALQNRQGSGDAEAMEGLSDQMQSISLGDVEIPVCSRTNQNFRPPNDLSIPIIMVGPGTGVAPFIGFLQERQLRKKELVDPSTYGETWLLFGCRNREKDFLFRSAFDEFQKSGTLTHFLPAFSRDGYEGDAKYVQDSIRSRAADIFRLIDEKEAVVFVCGDAKNMAKDVNAALEEVLQSQKGLTPEDAKAYMMTMRIHRRYLEDVWT